MEGFSCEQHDETVAAMEQEIRSLRRCLRQKKAEVRSLMDKNDYFLTMVEELPDFPTSDDAPAGEQEYHPETLSGTSIGITRSFSEEFVSQETTPEGLQQADVTESPASSSRQRRTRVTPTDAPDMEEDPLEIELDLHFQRSNKTIGIFKIMLRRNVDDP